VGGVVQSDADHRDDVKPINKEKGGKQRMGAATAGTPAPANPEAVFGPLLGADPAPVAAPADQTEPTARTGRGRNNDRSPGRGIAGRGQRRWPYDCHGVDGSPCLAPPSPGRPGGALASRSPLCQRMPMVASSMSIAEILPMIFIQCCR
jgi:hypothetical protein